MGNLFDADGAYARYMGRFLNMVVLSLLWLGCCIPIVTAGAATTALFFATYKCVWKEESGPLRTYLRSFRSGFRQATVGGVIILLLTGWLALDCYFLYYMAAEGDGGLLARFLLLFCVQLFLVVFAWGNSLLAYIGRFRVSMALALKNSLFLMLANAARFLLLAVLFLLHIILAVFFPWAILALPASYALCVNRLLDKIFQEHITTD